LSEQGRGAAPAGVGRRRVVAPGVRRRRRALHRPALACGNAV